VCAGPVPRNQGKKELLIPAFSCHLAVYRCLKKQNTAHQ
jgi:hypothetical protein